MAIIAFVFSVVTMIRAIMLYVLSNTDDEEDGGEEDQGDDPKGGEMTETISAPQDESIDIELKETENAPEYKYDLSNFE